jgi:hypothetical protein
MILTQSVRSNPRFMSVPPEGGSEKEIHWESGQSLAPVPIGSGALSRDGRLLIFQDSAPEERTAPTCSFRLHDRIFRWVVNIDQFPKSLARYIFRMEKRKETDQETIGLMRQYFSGGNRSEPAILVVVSPLGKHVSSGSSQAASDACSSRAEDDQLNLR